MPRPRKYEKGVYVTSISIPVEYAEMIEKARSKARAMGLSFSEYLINLIIQDLNLNNRDRTWEDKILRLRYRNLLRDIMMDTRLIIEIMKIMGVSPAEIENARMEEIEAAVKRGLYVYLEENGQRDAVRIWRELVRAVRRLNQRLGDLLLIRHLVKDENSGESESRVIGAAEKIAEIGNKILIATGGNAILYTDLEEEFLL